MKTATRLKMQKLAEGKARVVKGDLVWNADSLAHFTEEWDEFVKARWDRESVRRVGPDQVMRLSDEIDEMLPEDQQKAFTHIRKMAMSTLLDALEGCAVAEERAAKRYAEAREMLVKMQKMIEDAAYTKA